MNAAPNGKAAGRNLYLDLFKLFLAFLVICIHFAGEAYWYFPVYRLAVPMFFMISGYFNYHKDREILARKTVAFISRCVKNMILGFGIYMVYDFVMCYVNGNGVGYYFTTLFYENLWLDFFILNRPITYSGYQLWFLIALFVVSLLHFLLVRYQKEHWYYAIIPFGVAIYLFFQGYMHLFQETDMPIRYTRNALFFGLPMFGIGFTMAKYQFHKKTWYRYVYLALGILFFFLQIAESRLIVIEMYHSTILSAMCLLQFFVGTKSPKGAWYYRLFGKDLSFWVYVFHVAVGITLGMLITFSSPMVRCLAVFGISVVLAVIGHALRSLVLRWRSQRRMVPTTE
ncbi:MAG: acyltransferase [Ruminococcaceae bacterium]|nr:acyltransferase [Oscillospiraceae bacterium]